MSRIAIIDYGIGNVRSMVNAFESLSAEVILTRDRTEIMAADGVVLPGVGAFAHGMEKLDQYQLTDVIKDYARTGKPLLGVCLGMQMLFSHSEEFGHTPGLDLIPGKVVKLSPRNAKIRKLPHVSWNEIYATGQSGWDNTILEGVRQNEDMYFVHSFVARPDDAINILSTTGYSDDEFCSTVRQGNIYGCQYHPEKSADAGLNILRNFITMCKVNHDV
ncbi:imidazole glycerol phosphate synthase subunit HisH [Paremcibacter congregatus]|uniref:Imidazole glycerol phosphate synthase subunit HisH n=1 Tax=Paremcibacter congregatus TaxID=2043170 RepID=A0A2G4YR55_9PROT|nr:imidazole glycerol phosphate synthase subunit HisH [Paremcibacter congregatus]PHZ84809.1 imidazole glycerol phosphate synthase subunit HisH [Paremcibacter congregatus]QDE26217.1 imidazole glycerol phosphate synthase subunit HisH [Paremcibacter congregatus]|tara:strand:+ start:90 stop:743 length:654 start_codon:yes stop_codon:yes gene_type:complete